MTLLKTENPRVLRRDRESGRGWNYHIAGRDYRSVTDLLDNGWPKQGPLVPWAKSVTAEYAVERLDTLTRIVREDGFEAGKKYLVARADAVRDAKADLGRAVHDVVEAYALGTGDASSPDPDVDVYVRQFRAFLEAARPEFIASEAVVCNATHNYAGTLDSVAAIGGRNGVLDVKTSKGVYPEHAVQVAAYRNAEFMALPGGVLYPMPATETGWVLHLTPTAWALHEVACGPDVFEVFLAVQSVAEFHGRRVGEWRRKQRVFATPEPVAATLFEGGTL